jgi:hypothetical protein
VDLNGASRKGRILAMTKTENMKRFLELHFVSDMADSVFMRMFYLGLVGDDNVDEVQEKMLAAKEKAISEMEELILSDPSILSKESIARIGREPELRLSPERQRELIKEWYGHNWDVDFILGKTI